MGDRVTRVPQSRELLRAKRLRQALERGAPPTFVPSAAPNPVAQRSSLSWSSIEKRSGEKNSVEKAPAEKGPQTIPGKRFPGKRIRRKPVLKKLSIPAASISNNSFKIRRTRSSSPTLPSARSASIRNFSACSATPQRRSWENPSTSLSPLPIAPPKPIGSRNASSAVSPSLSKPSALRRTAPCSIFPSPAPP